MPGDLLVRNARVVLPDRVLREAGLRVRGGTIVELTGDVLEPHGEPVLEADGDWLLPGLVDVHCDAIEREVQPRPGVCLPFALVLAELDRKLALCGVTTVFHGVSFGAGEGVRSDALAAALVRAIAALGRCSTLVRHRAHVRLEVSSAAAVPLVAALIGERAVGMLSFMDHTPGQGQYRDPKRYREHVRETYWAGEEEVDRIVAQKLAGRALVGEEDSRALADRAEAAWLPLAGRAGAGGSAGRPRLGGAPVSDAPLDGARARGATGLPPRRQPHQLASRQSPESRPKPGPADPCGSCLAAAASLAVVALAASARRRPSDGAVTRPGR